MKLWRNACGLLLTASKLLPVSKLSEYLNFYHTSIEPIKTTNDTDQKVGKKVSKHKKSVHELFICIVPTHSYSILDEIMYAYSVARWVNINILT